MMRTIVVILIIASLSACGVRADLKPRAGKELPVAPYARTDKPSSGELLEATAQAAPQRSVELRQRSEERKDDPFSLPPKE